MQRPLDPPTAMALADASTATTVAPAIDSWRAERICDAFRMLGTTVVLSDDEACQFWYLW